MNKTIAAIIVLAAAISTPSCKKAYDCNCKKYSNGVVVINTTVTMEKQSKRDAESECFQYGYPNDTKASTYTLCKVVE
jgi:hypothetical protein